MTALRRKPKLPPNLSYGEEIEMRIDKRKSIGKVGFGRKIMKLVLDFTSFRFRDRWGYIL